MVVIVHLVEKTVSKQKQTRMRMYDKVNSLCILFSCRFKFRISKDFAPPSHRKQKTQNEKEQWKHEKRVSE